VIIEKKGFGERVPPLGRPKSLVRSLSTRLGSTPKVDRSTPTVGHSTSFGIFLVSR